MSDDIIFISTYHTLPFGILFPDFVIAYPKNLH